MTNHVTRVLLTASLDALLLNAHLITVRTSLKNARDAITGLEMSAKSNNASHEVAGLLAWWREDEQRMADEERRVLALLDG